MSTDREVTRIVRSWLEDGVTELPDRVLNEVLAELPVTPRRRVTWWPARRAIDLNSHLGLLGTAAAVIVIAVIGAIGIGLMRPQGIGGPGVTTTPTPSLAATPSLAPASSLSATPSRTDAPSPTVEVQPTGAASPEPLTSGPLDAGRYTFGVGPVDESGEFQCCGGRYFRTELTLPEGWSGAGISSAQVALGGPSGVYLEFFALQRVYSDPCHPELGYQGTYLSPSNAEDIVSEFGALVDFETSEITETTVDGLPTTHFVLSNDIDTEAADCTQGGLLPLFMTLEADKQTETTIQAHSPATNGGTTELIWVVNRDLFPLLIVGEYGSDEQAGRAALDEILASIDLS
jgi:hypothetical protein